MQTKVRIYFNLHRKLFTIQRQTPKGWRVAGHAQDVCLAYPQFKVSEAGRQRVLREKRKNVHAFVEGYLTLPTYGIDDLQRISYNPYKCGSFVIAETQQPVRDGRYLIGSILDSKPTLLAL